MVDAIGIALYLYIGLGCMAFVMLWLLKKAERPFIGWLITLMYIAGTYVYISGY